MFKKAYWILAVWSFLTLSTAQADQAPVTKCPERAPVLNEVPLPRSAQVSVNWDTMEGNWEIDGYLINLGRTTAIKGKKFFTVHVLDAKTGEKIKEGVSVIRGRKASGVITDSREGSEPVDTFVLFRAYLDSKTKRDRYIVTFGDLPKCVETHHQMFRPGDNNTQGPTSP